MKKIKFIFASLLSVLLICIFVGCSSNDVSSGSVDTANDNTMETTATTEATTQNTQAYVDEDGIVQNSELAKSCQKIIGSGADKNGDIYEIVANVNESYQGSELLVGVIKNSEWLIEPNNQCPYVNSERWGWDASGSDIELLDCGYLSNGTFYNSKDVTTASPGSPVSEGYLELWNVETNQYLYLEDTSSYSVDDYSNLDNRKTDSFVFVISEIHGINEKSTLYLLDTKTLNVEKLYEVVDDRSVICHQISDGLFYTSIDMVNKVRIGTFYNENGEKVFDLSEYDTDQTEIVCVGDFENGQCTIYNQLENGSKFKITIDKQGNMISEEKVEQETQSE